MATDRECQILNEWTCVRCIIYRVLLIGTMSSEGDRGFIAIIDIVIIYLRGSC